MDCIHCNRRVDVEWDSCPYCGRSQLIPLSMPEQYSTVCVSNSTWADKLNQLPSLFPYTSVVMLCFLTCASVLGCLSLFIVNTSSGYSGGWFWLLFVLPIIALVGLFFAAVEGFAILFDSLRLVKGQHQPKPVQGLHSFWPILCIGIILAVSIWFHFFHPVHSAQGF
ncbi:MAG: hypothetical protein K0Q50_2981 [Vampirovibrio sp.]|nr:hypothetical protein [Vampirovibrio sp.]